MREITKGQLDEILSKHKMWLSDEDGGERANLTDANLTHADLTYANLRDASFWGATANSVLVLSLETPVYSAVLIRPTNSIQIGCRQKPVHEWFRMSPKKIHAIGGDRSADFNKTWRPTIRAMVKAMGMSFDPPADGGEA